MAASYTLDGKKWNWLTTVQSPRPDAKSICRRFLPECVSLHLIWYQYSVLDCRVTFSEEVEEAPEKKMTSGNQSQ
jgi:hypothetical protein